jgi:hypothetical protein
MTRLFGVAILPALIQILVYTECIDRHSSPATESMLVIDVLLYKKYCETIHYTCTYIHTYTHAYMNKSGSTVATSLGCHLNNRQHPRLVGKMTGETKQPHFSSAIPMKVAFTTGQTDSGLDTIAVKVQHRVKDVFLPYETLQGGSCAAGVLQIQQPDPATGRERRSHRCNLHHMALANHAKMSAVTNYIIRTADSVSKRNAAVIAAICTTWHLRVT